VASVFSASASFALPPAFSDAIAATAAKIG